MSPPSPEAVPLIASDSFTFSGGVKVPVVEGLRWGVFRWNKAITGSMNACFSNQRLNRMH